jgi:predicted DNA-binding protein (MmcQ/YjbR family)
MVARLPDESSTRVPALEERNDMATREPKNPTEKALRERGLAWPETHEDFPWDHRALKVKGKVFAFLACEDGAFSMSVKLPQSGVAALDRPFAQPTGYGLGKSGWVSVQFDAGERPPLDLLLAWLEESYRAVAPKRVLKQLDGAPVRKPAAPAASKAARKRAKPASRTRPR